MRWGWARTAANRSRWMAQLPRWPDSRMCIDACRPRWRCMVDASSGDLDLVAILRGVRPERVVEIGDVLYEAGIRAVEVPLNSPDPFSSIGKLAARRSDWTI